MSDHQAILRDASDLLGLLIDEGGSVPLERLSVRIEVVGDQQNVVIEGGPGGLIYLACQCLDIAARTFSGAHAHIDEHSGADAGSLPLVVSLKLD